MIKRYSNVVANIRATIFTIGIIFPSLAAYADSPRPRPNFEKPEITQTLDVGMTQDVTPPAPIRLECQVYPTFAVVQINNPSIIGATLTVRKRDKRISTEALCAKDFSGPSVAISAEAGYLWGVLGPFLFVTSGDCFGIACEMRVYGAASGKLLFKDHYNNEGNLEVGANAYTPWLGYASVLEHVPCLPVDALCWDRVRRENGIPQTVHLVAPDCAKAISIEHSKSGEGLQISVPARVLDLFHPKITYASGTSSCDPAP